MIANVSPVIVFQLFETPVNDFLGKIPVAKFVNKYAGAPIPIYIEEMLPGLETGLVTIGHSRSIAVDTSNAPTAEGEEKNSKKDNSPDQRVITSTLTIDFYAVRESVVLNALIGLSDIVLSKVINKNYLISYFNGPNIIIGGFLESFSATDTENSTLMRVSLTLGKRPKNDTKEAEKKTNPGAQPIPAVKSSAPLAPLPT